MPVAGLNDSGHELRVIKYSLPASMTLINFLLLKLCIILSISALDKSKKKIDLSSYKYKR